VQRLLEPPRRSRRGRYGLALTMVMLPLALAPGLAVTLAGPLTAHGITIG
jgi:hypothetical protein